MHGSVAGRKRPRVHPARARAEHQIFVKRTDVHGTANTTGCWDADRFLGTLFTSVNGYRVGTGGVVPLRFPLFRHLFSSPTLMLERLGSGVSR